MDANDDFQSVLFEQQDGIVILTLNEPETRNALSNKMLEQIIAYCERINADIDARCVILTGSGKGFSSGGNVKEMRDQSGSFDRQPPSAIRRQLQAGIQQLGAAIYGLEVPIIAAVNGHAIGAGCDLSLMCDIRIAADDAVFAESFLQLGLVPGDGGAWFLPRIVGLSRAYEMTFTCDRISAVDAAEIGMVSRMVPRENLLSEARALAARIVDKPPQSVRLAKRLIRDSMRLTLPESLEMAASMQAIAQSTSDHSEAVNAFLEKRKPEFKGC